MDGLSRLNRPATQLEDPLTAEYVNAGLSMVEAALDFDPDAGQDAHPFLAWISQRRVVDLVNDRKAPMSPATVASLRDRWQRHGDYLWDLVDHIRARRPGRSFPERAKGAIRLLLLSRSGPSAIVRNFARGLEEGVFANQFFRIQLLGLAVVGGSSFRDSSAMDDVSDLYEQIDQRWIAIIDRFMEKFDLDYRVGVKQADLIELGTAITEGLALRELADPTEGHRREERLRLHSTGLLCLLHSLTMPSEKAERSVSLDKAVDAMVNGSTDA